MKQLTIMLHIEESKDPTIPTPSDNELIQWISGTSFTLFGVPVKTVSVKIEEH